MKNKYMIVIMLLVIVSTNVVALGQLPSLARMFLGDSVAKGDGGLNHLTKNIYSVNGVIEEQVSDTVQLIDLNIGDSDFINTLTHGRSSMAVKIVPDRYKVKEIKGAACSNEPDYSKIINTNPTTLQLCFFNDENFDLGLRLWDIDSNMKYIMEKPVMIGKEVCFEAKPNRQYLYEVSYCTKESCECTLYTNEFCEIRDGHLQMYRTRSCEPSGCKSDEAWVDWIDTTATNCDSNYAFCKETDGGKDYLHYGKVYFENKVKADACISDNKIIEYFCEDNEISQQIKYCKSGQKCDNGECVNIPSKKKDCGIIDGEERLHGYVWCDKYTLHNCTDGEIIESFGHELCAKKACDYNGMIVGSGQKICLDDGITIAECSNPDSVNKEFKYKSCPIDQECVPNTFTNVCKYVDNEIPMSIQSEGINFWTWLKSLIGGSE